MGFARRAAAMPKDAMQSPGRIGYPDRPQGWRGGCRLGNAAAR